MIATWFFYLGAWPSLVIRYVVIMAVSSQQQPTTNYKETSKLLPGVSPQTKSETHHNHNVHEQFNYANIVLTVPCTNNDFIFG